HCLGKRMKAEHHRVTKRMPLDGEKSRWNAEVPPSPTPVVSTSASASASAPAPAPAPVPTPPLPRPSSSSLQQSTSTRTCRITSSEGPPTFSTCCSPSLPYPWQQCSYSSFAPPAPQCPHLQQCYRIFLHLPRMGSSVHQPGPTHADPAQCSWQ